MKSKASYNDSKTIILLIRWELKIDYCEYPIHKEIRRVASLSKCHHFLDCHQLSTHWTGDI
jgi:hypothetical protein